MNVNHLFTCTYDKFEWRKVILNKEDFEDEDEDDICFNVYLQRCLKKMLTKCLLS